MKKIILISLILLTIISCKKGSREGNTKGPLSFKLKSIDGETVNLEDYKGSYLLIDFWASWCPPCKQAIPYIVEFFNKYAGDNFYIIGIGLENENPLFAYAKKENIPYLVLVGNRDIANYYGIQAIPTLVLLDPEGKIVYKNVGFSEEEMAKLEGKIKEIKARL